MVRRDGVLHYINYTSFPRLKDLKKVSLFNLPNHVSLFCVNICVVKYAPKYAPLLNECLFENILRSDVLHHNDVHRTVKGRHTDDHQCVCVFIVCRRVAYRIA